MKILVLGGGTGSEREVSIRSSKSVREALKALGHEVQAADPADGEAAVRSAATGCELVLPILHGVSGEDGSIQSLLDDIGLPYFGSGVTASKLCFDKARFKSMLIEHGITTPQSDLVTAETFDRSPLVQTPFVLKPVADGSSVGVLISRSLPFDAAKAHKLLNSYETMLVEQLVVGTEITVGVLGSQALPVIEIVPPAGGDFDYENKYNGATAELCPPQNVSQQLQKQAQDLAVHIHQLSGARHLSRTDMIIDASGKIYVLELNTLPGLTKQSLFPKAAATAGLAWNELVASFVELAKTT